MKTIREVVDWCNGAEAQFGDPAIPVAQIFVRYVADIDSYRGEDLAFGFSAMTGPNADVAELRLRLFPGESPREWPVRGVALPVAMDGPRFALDQLLTFGVRPVAPGLWYLHPSLNIPGEIHTFVVLYDVPTPAPWDTEAGRLHPNDPPLGVCDLDPTPHWVGCGNHNELLTPCRNWRSV